MNFLQPLFLAGLLAIAVPLFIHLINRRKAVTRQFPALRLLKESNERVARSVKVRQWILLALRMLAIAVLALALAKPYLLSTRGITAEERLPTAVVLIVENGFAMDHDDWWPRAQREARDQIGGLRPFDEVALLTTASPPGSAARLTSDHGAARRAVDGLSRRYEIGDLPAALTRAADLLSGSQLPNRRIVIVGSGTTSPLANQRPDLELRHPVEYVSVRRGADNATTPNTAVVAVDSRQYGSAADGNWEFNAVIRNFGDDDRDGLRVQLRVDDHVVAGGTVDVPAGQHATYSFQHRVEGDEPLPAAVELVDSGDLSVDDTWHFLIRPRRQVRALLINGSPSSNPLNDELFFLTRALSSAEAGSITSTVTTVDGLSRRTLEDFDVVVMANVPRLSRDDAARLYSFVEDGGGLLVTMGDEVDTEAYNRHFSELLPRPLRGMKLLAERDDPDAPIKTTRLGQPQRQHPVFQVFGLPGGASLQSVSVYSYMLLDPAPSDRESRILLAYQDNAPALLERSVGQGRVLLFTTSIDRDWSDFPIRTAYLPTVQRSLLYLARRATSGTDDVHTLGEPLRLEVGELARERAILHGPDGDRLVEEITDGVATFHPTRPGVYRFFADRDDHERHRIDNLDLTVNVDRTGSLLATFPLAELDRWQRDKEGTLLVEGDTTQERRVNLWSYLLFLVTLALLAETVLGSRRSVLVRTFDRIAFWRR